MQLEYNTCHISDISTNLRLLYFYLGHLAGKGWGHVDIP